MFPEISFQFTGTSLVDENNLHIPVLKQSVIENYRIFRNYLLHVHRKLSMELPHIEITLIHFVSLNYI
jgi:hypothetical protein